MTSFSVLPGIHVVQVKFISFVSVLSLGLLVSSLQAAEELTLEQIKEAAATQSKYLSPLLLGVETETFADNTGTISEA